MSISCILNLNNNLCQMIFTKVVGWILAYFFIIKIYSPLKVPPAIMAGFLGWNAKHIRQLGSSMVVSGFSSLTFRRSKFQVHRAVLCVHQLSCSNWPNLSSVKEVWNSGYLLKPKWLNYGSTKARITNLFKYMFKVY